MAFYGLKKFGRTVKEQAHPHGAIGASVQVGIRERISTVKADQRQRGRYLGGKVPFGFAPGADGALDPVAAEQDAIALIRRLKAEGKALRPIAEAVAATGIKLSHQGVAEVLKRCEAA